ncbi:sulfate transporter CysZ [Salinisphaera hydrothermalis]|uniref:Sulfate transport protein CysZ n=1 Tax=Salinisphaera hydrothermalis (strain C41B8) TaxID=1304275 RepID=A0A084IJV6_SALHC|nr:sulfate transporter CysZ [Salinisphaera hydrothermalis]KEZ76990.1 sulfate transport protein CysZ [Salinisphaera hydrothermalis C41B8]
MNPVSELIIGPSYLARGFGLLTAPGLRRYVILPVLVNVVLIVALMGLLGWQLNDWLNAWLAGLPTWLAWLEDVLWWLGMIISTLAFCYFFTLLANLIASPFNGMLSARVEKLHTGHEPNSGMSIAGEMWDGLIGELRRLRYYASRAALLGLVSLVLLFIPVANLAIAPLWFVFGAFMLAFEYLDQPMANRGLPFDAKMQRLYARGWRHLGFGSVVTLATALPLANLVVMPAAVIGATLLYMETDYPLIDVKTGHDSR